MEPTTSRILLIEHCTRGLSATFAQFLFGAGSGVRLNMVSSLKDAQHRLKEGGVGLILLSLHLPEGPGIDLLRRVQELAEGIPVAVLMNSHERHLTDELRGMGAAGCYEYGKVPVEEAIRLCARRADKPALADLLANAAPSGDIRPVTPALVPPAPQAQPVTPTPAAEPAAEVFETCDAAIIEDDAGESATELAVDAVAVEIPETPSSTALPLQSAACESAPECPAAAAIATADLKAADAGMPRTSPQPPAAAGAQPDLENALRALEERCRELEAGQTALIEAEHVAIEREKAARQAAEAEVATLRTQLTNATRPAAAADPAELVALRTQVQALTGRTQELESALSETIPAREAAVTAALEEERATAQARKTAFLAEQARREEALRKQASELETKLKDLQWQLRDAQMARDAAQARHDELTASAALASGAARDLVELRAQLEVGVERRKHLENKFSQTKAELTAAQQRNNELEALVNRLHVLSDKAAEADALAAQLEQLRKDVQIEVTARQLITVELNKSQAREARLKTLEEASREFDWKLRQKEQELANAQAQLDDLALWTKQLEKNLAEEQSRHGEPARKLEGKSERKSKRANAGPAAMSSSANDESLRTQVRDLQNQIARLELEKAEFARQQLNKLEELTALYEKAQLERLELSNQLANRPAGR